jgi:hypothetical protein
VGKDNEDSQQEAWENRLAFLNGITQGPEGRASLIDSEATFSDNALVDPIKTRPKRFQRIEKQVRNRQMKRRRLAAQPTRTPLDTSMTEARERVKRRVVETQNEILKENMPKLAISLYREGREILASANILQLEEFYEGLYFIEATVDAFKVANRPKDAADVLLFLAKWIITKRSDTFNIPTKFPRNLVTEARSYIDPNKDYALLKRCDELELVLVALKDD